MPFDSIHIIYNPNSTGNGKALAEQLQQDLLQNNSILNVEMHQTKHAGHAEELAHTIAQDKKHPLIISSSGDGGYNEVVNAIVAANSKGAQAVAGLLPAGNANDHYNSLHSGELVDNILHHKTKSIDILILQASKNGNPYTRYAHSYIGIGLTPKVGKELNKHKLKFFNEIILVAKVLLNFNPVRLRIKGQQMYFDSLIFSNIPQMSKVLTLAKDASPTDGLFEVTIFRRRNRFKLIGTLIHTSIFGYKGVQQYKSYTFRTVKSTLVQLDGEVMVLDANAQVKIGIKQTALECII